MFKFNIGQFTQYSVQNKKRKRRSSCAQGRGNDTARRYRLGWGGWQTDVT